MERKNVSAVQTVYNILEQTPGNELIERGAEKDVGILIRVPDASGILTGKVFQASTDSVSTSSASL